MNRDLRSLMAFIAYNQMDKARDFVKKFCESNEVKSDYGYCNMLLSQLRRSGGYLMELLPDIQNLLFKDDIAGLFSRSLSVFCSYLQSIRNPLKSSFAQSQPAYQMLLDLSDQI